MKKIISLFQRNYDGDRLVRNEVVPGAEWVIAGDGIATRKWDGTCCLVREGKLFKRYEVKPGKTAPKGFEPAGEVDSTTGKQQGWIAVGDGPEDRWHREAFTAEPNHSLPDGTYELVGPKIQGNPDGFSAHILVPHGHAILDDAPRNFDDLKQFLSDGSIEGIVWHHPDGRMVKIKAKDFGIKRASAVFPTTGREIRMNRPERLIGRCFRGKTVTFEFLGKHYIVVTEDVQAIEALWEKMGFVEKCNLTLIKNASLIPDHYV